MSYSIDIDIGGTFTDLFAVKQGDGQQISKTPTTHYDLSVGFMKGIKNLAKLYGPESFRVFIPDRCGQVLHHLGNQRLDRKDRSQTGSDHHRRF